MNNIWVCDIFKSLHSECIYIFKVSTFLEIGLKENIKILHSNSLFYNCIQISPKYQEEKGHSLYIGAGRTKRGSVQKHTLWDIMC